MNKRAFTLIELLASLVIVSLILTITITSITKVVKDSKKDISEAQIELIKKGAENYISSNISNIPVITSGSKTYYITLSELIESGIIDRVKNIKGDYYTDSDLVVKVVITYNEKYKKNNTIVSVITDKDEVLSIKNNYTSLIPSETYCKAVDSNTKTTGNIPTGEYSLGDEYICTVTDDKKYHFFIISSDSTNVNLIMDRNINSKGEYASSDAHNVDWYTSTESYTIYSYNTFGPASALSSLMHSTKDWKLPNIILDYLDENLTDTLIEGDHTIGYNKIVTIDNVTKILKNDNTVVDNYTNLKARLPKMSELISNGCSTNTACPLWLSNYISSSASLGGVSKSFTEGYWTLSSSSYKNNSRHQYAWAVGNMGNLVRKSTYDYDDSIDSYNYTIGIRPVISVPKSSLR